ncbi:MAG: phosphonate transport system permease protein [Planctomycetota bacterium]|jgi:phosphonate transport system permease protein
MSALDSSTTIDHQSEVRRLYKTRPRSRLLTVSLVLLTALALYSWIAPDIEWSELFTSQRASNFDRFIHRDAFPFPMRESGFTFAGLFEWVASIWKSHGSKAVFATLWISVLAIVLASFFALVLAPLGAHTLSTAQAFGAANDRQRNWPWRALVVLVRLACVALRAIPEYVWAFLLLAMLGPSAWPAVLALAIHNSGILARLGSETIENLESAPLESLASLGSSRRQLATFAAFPIALPRLLLYFFYRFETCVREATVLGMLGVVSLGYWIADARARQNYDEMILLVAFSAMLVLIVDLISILARRFIR